MLFVEEAADGSDGSATHFNPECQHIDVRLMLATLVIHVHLLQVSGFPRVTAMQSG